MIDEPTLTSRSASLRTYLAAGTSLEFLRPDVAPKAGMARRMTNFSQRQLYVKRKLKKFKLTVTQCVRDSNPQFSRSPCIWRPRSTCGFGGGLQLSMSRLMMSSLECALHSEFSCGLFGKVKRRVRIAPHSTKRNGGKVPAVTNSGCVGHWK